MKLFGGFINGCACHSFLSSFGFNLPPCLLLGRAREGERGVARYPLVGNTFHNQTRHAHDVGILF